MRHFILKKPRVLHEFVNGYGSIGQTLPTAIGMAVALNKSLALIEGDGERCKTFRNSTRLPGWD